MLIYYNFSELDYHLANAQFVSTNIKTAIDKNGKISDSGKVNENKTTSTVKTTEKKTKLKDQNQQPKDESKLNARERTNTPDNSRKSISEIVKELSQILTFIEVEFNKLHHQQR